MRLAYRLLRTGKRSALYFIFLLRQPFQALSFYLKWNNSPIDDINRFEWKVFSQDGEDGILQAMLRKTGTTNKFCVEFGAGDGIGCNTGLLVSKQGWGCLHMDLREDAQAWVKREKITAENINSLFAKYGVPKEFDVLSIDIDFNDYWVWKALEGYSPRIVVVEYNASVPAGESRVVEYDPNASWDGTDYFGASLLAYTNLAKAKGYTLVGCNSLGVNAFFIRNDLNANNFMIRDTAELYRPPGYGQKIAGSRAGHPPSKRQMVNI